jgi:DNA invertase Pin-like site-specific DNA recombinase
LWAESSGHRRGTKVGPGGLRFAFYGRVSTEDHQDPATSRARQLDQAAALVAGFGWIVAEFFDAGHSRVLPWARRPLAAALLAALADPDCPFDAVVIGEYERAFYGSQYALMAPLFEHYGVQLWMPEAGGRVNFAAEGDEQLMLALGVQSKREITRTRIRVRTAMAAQARDQGRYLGGRPPYGYRLADAGPHPNKAHAAWGRRAHRLEPDPHTAPVVRWMFAQRALSAAGPRPAEFAGPQVGEPASPGSLPLRQVASPVAIRAGGRRPDAGVADGGRVLQRRAWQWALAHRWPDGSLPTGTEVAREFGRSQRWGRLVTNTGRGGQLGAGA